MYEVKVYRPNGELKETISREDIIKRHWAALPEVKPSAFMVRADRAKCLCSVCKEPFIRDDERRKTCGPVCQRVRQKAYNRARYHAKHPPTLKPCEECKKPFTPKYHRTMVCGESCQEKRKKRLHRIRFAKAIEARKRRKLGKLGKLGLKGK